MQPCTPNRRRRPVLVVTSLELRQGLGVEVVMEERGLLDQRADSGASRSAVKTLLLSGLVGSTRLAERLGDEQIQGSAPPTAEQTWQRLTVISMWG